MTDDLSADAWLPFSVPRAGVDATVIDRDAAGVAWSRLIRRLGEAGDVITHDPGAVNDADLVSGLRHVLVLLAVALDGALYADDTPVLRVATTSTDDVMSWGMECADALYTRAALKAGESYRLWGNRGTAQYVGLQTMDGATSTSNALVDELEVAADGSFEVVLSSDKRDGNWMQITGDQPNLVVRHFFYDWETEVPSTLFIERIDGTGSAPAPTNPVAATPARIAAIGDFVLGNLNFFLAFGQAAAPNTFMAPFDQTSMGGAAENRPVIGRWQLAEDEALVLEVVPPVGVYWSLSVGNPWWETIHYGRHQSSLNAHQAVLDEDGVFRAVISAHDPGIANWIDNAGHSNGPMILRCVRTETAPTPEVRVVKLDQLADVLPPGTARVTPEQRSAVLAVRRAAVAARFPR
ncbi:MAG: hypothetical protein JWP74_745 [Marmoricola sp.]|nr:hypothetical protein [Marmoricola sp.]